MDNREQLGKRILMSVIGVLICGISVGMFKRAELGVDPFQSLMSGLNAVIPIRIGTLYLVANALLLLFALLNDRRKIGIATLINLLFFGYIREYKGLKHLIRALPEIRARRPQAHLFVVGDFWENNREEYEQLIRETGTGDAITLVDGYLPDDEVEPYFAAADLCVLPYESATQSGVIQIAYSFGLPVIATEVGGLPEVVLDNRTGFVVPPKDAKALSQAVVRFFEENKAESFKENIKEEDSRYSWDRMTEHVDGLMAQLQETKK